MNQSEEFLSDDEYDKTALQTWKEISITTGNAEYCASILEDEVKQSYSDEENEDQCEDPLDDNGEDVKITVFQGEYNELDFISELTEDGQMHHSSIPSRSKRSKTSSEFKSPNGHIWSTNKVPFKKNATIDLNVLKLLPKAKGPATKAQNALEVWYLLLDEGIMAIILTYTNEKIHSLKGKLSYQRRTDIVELRAWLGLNYLCGIFRNTTHPGPISELWTWELGNSIFRATMSWKRFEFLATCISFTAPITKTGVLQNVMVIKDVWERFLANCRSYYSPSGNCMVRDLVTDFSDTNNNIRLSVLCDTKSMYICNALISTQIDSKDTFERIVLHLLTDIKGSNRNIVLPEQYTSAEVAQKLKQRQLSMVGALSNLSQDCPQTLPRNDTYYKLYSDIGCLMSGTAETSPILLTNCLPDKVAIERLFKSSNQSWYHLEQEIGAFSTKYAASETFNNVALTLFYYIMDFAVFNAWILLQLSTSGICNAPTQREFQRDLGLYLTQMQLKRQLHDKNKLTLAQKLQISDVLGEPTDRLLAGACEVAKKNSAKGFVPSDKLDLPNGLVLMAKTLERRKRCCICVKYQTRTRCQQCLRALCYRHLIVRCNNCMGVTELPDS